MTEPAAQPPEPVRVDLTALWSLVDSDLRQLAQSRRITDVLSLSPEIASDDVRQLAALHVIERLAKQPDFVNVLTDRDLRRAYLFATLHNYSRALQRRTRRRRSLAGRVSQILEREESANLDKTDLYEIYAKLLERAPPTGPARLAIEVISEVTTLPKYAEEAGVSLRTAQRRFLIGMNELREIARRFE